MNRIVDPGEGFFRIFIAWAGMVFGVVNVNALLAGIALVLTIIFTWYQIVKIRKDLKRQERLDALEAQLQRNDDRGR